MRQSSAPRMSRPGGAPAARLRRRDPRTPLFIGAGIASLFVLVWVLFLPPVSLLRGGSGWADAGEDSLVRRRSDPPKPPEGLLLASPYYEIRSKQDRGVGPATMTVPLGGGSGGRGLALYTFASGAWKRLGPAEVTPDGRSAKGQVDQVPDNVIVMRRAAVSFQVQAILPPGANLIADAEKLIQLRSPADYVPGADGSVGGAPSPGASTEAIALVPVVRASAGAEAQAVNQILASEQVRGAHVAALAKLVQTNKLDGLDLEYTAIEQNQGPSFTAFVAALSAELHRTGQTVTVTLPLPRREGSNWNTFGYEWKELVKSADYVRILPERDQRRFRMGVRDGLNYLTSTLQIDPKKLILTISPYAVEQSGQEIRTMTAVEALSIAAQITIKDRDQLFGGSNVEMTADNLNRGGGAGAGLIWAPDAAAVSFVYGSGDTMRTVWIENVFSAAFKLEFAKVWGLGGVAVEDGSDTLGLSNIWPAIDQFIKNGNTPVLQQPRPDLMQSRWQVDGVQKMQNKSSYIWPAPPAPGEHSASLIVSDGVISVIGTARFTLKPGSPPVSPTPAGGRAPSPTATTTR